MANKQMIGTAYHIIYHGDSTATVNCSYLCPYCKQKTATSFDAGSDAFPILERGGFFEPLTCDNCGEVTDVRFWSDNKR